MHFSAQKKLEFLAIQGSVVNNLRGTMENNGMRCFLEDDSILLVIYSKVKKSHSTKAVIADAEATEKMKSLRTGFWIWYISLHKKNKVVFLSKTFQPLFELHYLNYIVGKLQTFSHNSFVYLYWQKRN